MPTMNTRLLSGIVVALSLTVVVNAALQPLAAQVQHAECSHLTTLKLPDVKVTEAVAVPAADTGPVRCEGTVVYRGGRVATAEGKLIAEKTGRLLAHGTTTCLVITK